MNGALAPIGSALRRPECVLATYRGDLFTSDSRGGVMHIRPDGNQVLLTGRSAELPGGIAPNGIALQPDGSFLLAHLGEQDGGVFTLCRDGQLAPLLREVDDVPLPPTKYVTRDHSGRLWVTVSTPAGPAHRRLPAASQHRLRRARRWPGTTDRRRRPGLCQRMRGHP